MNARASTRRRAASVAWLVLVALTFPARTAHASGPGAGVINFAGRIALPASPCPTGCSASFDGVANVVASGVDGGQTPWTAAAPVIPMTFTYTYLNSCIAGLAQGSALIQAMPVEAVGTYGGATTAGSIRDVVGLAVFMYLDWLQLGSTIIVKMNGALMLQVQSTNVLTGSTTRFWTGVMSSWSGTGVGVIAGERVPECFGNGPPASLHLAAISEFSSTS